MVGLEDKIVNSLLKCKSKVIFSGVGKSGIISKKISEFYSLIHRRALREPIAYIFNEKEFWSKKFEVTKDTLIPRPETELMVEKLIKIYQDKNISILDLGTGSGCILISLLSDLRKSKGVGIDISEKALHLSLQKIYSHKQGNNHSLDRSEVAGSGKKLFKQKGTGNARAGNKKTTQRRGGGKAFGPKFHVVSYKVNKKVKKSALVSSIVSKSNNKTLFVFDEEKLDEKNISDLLKKNPNKMIIFVLSNINENKLTTKFQNYKKIYFLSDNSYSVHTALKSDMILFSKKSTIYNSHIGNN